MIKKLLEKKQNMTQNQINICSFLSKLILFIIMLWIIFGVVFGLTSMKNANMKPAINAGDLMLYYRLERKYNATDIIVFNKDGKEYMGRIVAMPHDEVEITNESKLKINDSIVIENNIYYSTPKYDEYIDYPLALDNDEYFVLCDYREGSKDSRYFGAVKKNEIKGKVITLIRRNNL